MHDGTISLSLNELVNVCADGGGDEPLVQAVHHPGHGADAAQGSPMEPRLRHPLLLPPTPAASYYLLHYGSNSFALHPASHTLAVRYGAAKFINFHFSFSTLSTCFRENFHSISTFRN
jgi:hypothetical protein